MDALTFGTKVLLRHLTFSEARKMPIKEFYLERVLEALEFSMDEVGCIFYLILDLIVYLIACLSYSSSTSASSSAATTATLSEESDLNEHSS